MKRLNATIVCELAAFCVGVESCCGFPIEYKLILKEPDRSAVEADPNNFQAELHMAGGANSVIPPLPRSAGRVTLSGRSNHAPKRTQDLIFDPLWSQKRGQKMGPFSGLKMRPHFRPHLEIHQ